MSDDLANRLDALERTLAGDDPDDGTDRSDRDGTTPRHGTVARLERRMDDIETTVEELEAAVEAVRGYAGNVRAVNRDVERRASAALAKAEALEASVGHATAGASGPSRESADARVGADRDLSREPTVIADSDHDPTEVHSPPDTAGADHSDDPDGRDAADGPGDRSDTDQFVERVRDAL